MRVDDLRKRRFYAVRVEGAVRGDAGTGQAPGQFRREQDIGQLRAAVRPHDPVAAPGEAEVVEVERAGAMGDRRHRDHARGGAAHHEIEQEIRQQEVAEMIDREGRLETIFRTLIDVGELRAGVEDKRVDTGTFKPLIYRLRKSSHAR